MDLFLDYLYGAAAYAHHHYSGMHGAEVERKRFSGSPCMIHLDAVKVIDGNIRSGFCSRDGERPFRYGGIDCDFTFGYKVGQS